VSRCSEAGCLRISSPPSSWVSCACAPLQGFQRVADGLADTCLDNPAARERFMEIVSKARLSGLSHSQLVKVSTLLCFLLPVTHALERCRSPCAFPPIIGSLCIRAQQHHACFPHLRWNKCGHKASNQVAFCMLQAERGGWLDAGACGELANVPAAAGSLPDAMSHSVQVCRRGLVPSALPAAWQTQERLLSQAAFHPRRTPSHLSAVYIGASLKAVLSCYDQLDGPNYGGAAQCSASAHTSLLCLACCSGCNEPSVRSSPHCLCAP